MDLRLLLANVCRKIKRTEWVLGWPSNRKSEAVVSVTLQRPVSTAASRIKLLCSAGRVCSKATESWPLAGRGDAGSVFHIGDSLSLKAVRVNGQYYKCQTFNVKISTILSLSFLHLFTFL